MNLDVFNFNFQYDDGKVLNDYDSCDCIILGPSRVGKTPLCFYLGYFNIKAMNIPLVPEIALKDIDMLPRKKCFGLIRSVEAISNFRISREEFLGLKTNYSSEKRIFEELEYAREIYGLIRCPIINLDEVSIEEASELIKKRINF
ncbi:MAG: kinase/pyrophosphorylase [Ezakiella sp.]|nr:kinase/pyrophosphorylase [Ezakiella sp.]